jgi:DNA-binding response OmpR family regulator
VDKILSNYMGNVNPGPVLIIEDDPDIAEALRYSLERERFQTRVALTGEEGLSASLDKSDPPSIILLDLLLPGMKGTEICRRLRQERMTSNTPILVITAKAMETDLTMTLQAGANDFITKPFSIRDVIKRVRALLSIASDVNQEHRDH